MLVHAGNKSELQVKDKSGFTPAELAANRGQRHVAYVLVCYSQKAIFVIVFIHNICQFTI